MASIFRFSAKGENSFLKEYKALWSPFRASGQFLALAGSALAHHGDLRRRDSLTRNCLDTSTLDRSNLSRSSLNKSSLSRGSSRGSLNRNNLGRGRAL